MKHVRGPETLQEAEAMLAAQLGVTEGEAARLLLRHQRAEGESWARAVDRIVAQEERRRASILSA